MSSLDLTGYHLTYDQEFTDPNAFKVSPDGSLGGSAGFKSQYDWGGRSVPTNHEAEFYSDPSIGVNPFSVQNGELTITAQDATPGQRSDGMPYTSGMITTQNTFSQHGGYFEIRAEVAGGQGVWPSFWMLPNTGADYPELDVMEDPNLGPPDQYWVHATAPTGGGGGYVQTGTTLAAGYHTYGVEWNDQNITFYFDGQSVNEVSTPDAFASLKMYMIAGLAVGGVNSWPATPGNNSIPAQYKIDYIRAYSNNPSDPAVALQPTSSPDGANTTPVLPRGPDIGFMDTTTNQGGTAQSFPYSGPVAGLQSDYMWAGNDSVNITASSPNMFLKSGAGTDALAVTSGSNVLDGGTGSNFLVGATGADGGHDTFFTDARDSAVPVWSSLVNFHSGDSMTLWGFTPGVSTMTWADSQGAAGYQGATLHAATAGPGTAVNASVTLVGFSTSDVATKMTTSTGSTGGNNYLNIHFN